MFLILPKYVETLRDRHPWGNWLLILSISVVSILGWTSAMPDSVYESLLLQRALTPGILGHIFLHADIFHLAGNMIFLWVFGNAICSNTSDIRYLLLFFIGGLGAAFFHVVFDVNPALGASGAVNAIVGVTLAMYPLNRVNMFVLIFVQAREFNMRVWHLALIWFAFDLFGALSGGGGVAYWAHIGGVLTGLGLGLVGLHTQQLLVTRFDNETLLQLLGGTRTELEIEEEEDDDLAVAAVAKPAPYAFTPPSEEVSYVSPPVPPPPKKKGG